MLRKEKASMPMPGLQTLASTIVCYPKERLHSHTITLSLFTWHYIREMHFAVTKLLGKLYGMNKLFFSFFGIHKF